MLSGRRIPPAPSTLPGHIVFGTAVIIGELISISDDVTQHMKRVQSA